ncbi:MAG TPA: hypothetical protein VJ826_01415, partial [Candidatus Polarisedimenticolaceae bacterium]|nr:hypothetical protein [Candidatus Polarisedimenticolaceae bacterium]
MVSLDPDSCSEEWDAMRILERGTIEEVWTAFEEGEEPDFDGIGEPDYEPLAECRVALVRSLVRAVDRRDDIRIPARILDEIDFDLAPALEPVLQAGLRHRAPEIRRRAARAVTDAEDLDWAGVVEERFAIETDEGVRRDLMTALAMMESRRFVREIGEIAAGADLASMRIAVDALTALPVEEDSVSALERFALMQEDDSQELLAVIDALGESTDIPHARDLLRRIEESGPTDAARRAGKLLDPPDAETMSVTFSCGGGSGVPSRALPLATGNFREFEDLLFYVDPDDGELTARCWDAPGFMWPDDLRPRVDIGTAVRVNDEFVWKGQPWYL